MEKITYQLFIASLSKETKEKLKAHFNTIHEVNELSEQELYIAYLAHLIEKDIVFQDENSTYNWDLTKAEFNDEKAGYWEGEEWYHGYHPAIDSYYDLDKIKEILH